MRVALKKYPKTNNLRVAKTEETKQVDTGDTETLPAISHPLDLRLYYVVCQSAYKVTGAGQRIQMPMGSPRNNIYMIVHVEMDDYEKHHISEIIFWWLILISAFIRATKKRYLTRTKTCKLRGRKVPSCKTIRLILQLPMSYIFPLTVADKAISAIIDKGQMQKLITDTEILPEQSSTSSKLQGLKPRLRT